MLSHFWNIYVYMSTSITSFRTACSVSSGVLFCFNFSLIFTEWALGQPKLAFESLCWKKSDAYRKIIQQDRIYRRVKTQHNWIKRQFSRLVDLFWKKARDHTEEYNMNCIMLILTSKKIIKHRLSFDIASDITYAYKYISYMILIYAYFSFGNLLFFWA